MSDSIALFAAIAVEAAINYYGVLRFGEDVYHDNFERLRVPEKLRIILLVCDDLELENGDSILRCANQVAQRRNRLAHSKAKDMSKPGTQVERVGPVIVDAAREAVADCDAFFDALMALVPNATGLDPRAV